MNTITKTDLIEVLAAKSVLHKYQVKNLVEELFDEMQGVLERGDRITIRGFGTFETKTFKSHAAVHPTTKEEFVVPEFKRVVFRPGEELLRTIRSE